MVASSAPGAAAALRKRTIDERAIAELVEEAKATRSDALIVLHEGRTLVDFASSAGRKPIQSMSITKSVLALVVGCLVGEGKLSLDRRIQALYPGWAGERQAKVKLGHLLSHTSGIEEGDSTREIYASRSFVEQALASPIVHEPGTHYEYGNRASNLLAGVIARAAGEPTEAVARRCLFDPLGIERTVWSRDRAGQAHGLAGLHLLPRDLAKIGELVLGEGSYAGRRVLGADWVRKVTREAAPVQPAHKRLALLFWLVPEWTERSVEASVIEGWRAAGVDPSLVDKLRKLEGRRFRSGLELVRALRTASGDPELEAVEREIWERKLPDARYTFGPIVGSAALGSLGQYLIVLPADRLVAVRMRASPRDPAERDDIEKNWPDFPDRVVALGR